MFLKRSSSRLAGGCTLVPKASLNKQTIRLTPYVLPVSLDTYRIPVVDAHGSHLFWASESQAHQLVATHQVALIRRHGRTIALRAVPDATETILEDAGRGSALGGSRYADRNESSDNPPGVWKLRRLMRDRWLYNDGVLLRPLGLEYP
jgi:hypothetical protein